MKKTGAVISDDEWRAEGVKLFGTNKSWEWRYCCPKCKKETDTHVKCHSCGFTNCSKSAEVEPLKVVLWHGQRIPVFPFLSGEVEGQCEKA